MAVTSYDVTCEKKKIKKTGSRSPYLSSDRVQLLSRVTEKKIVHKKTLDYVSSFPLAVNLYKANSGDLNSVRKPKKKNKKSVLTISNEPASRSQKCTVSDINDSEYYSQSNEGSKPRLKKRTSIKNVRKPRVKNKDYEYRDARYCSQININLKCSSTDVFKNYKGDCKGMSMTKVPLQKGSKKALGHPDTNENGYEVAPHDVWGMLRNMNRFQFVSSPPVSEGSFVAPKKKKKAAKKRMNCEDTRTSVIETAEIAYISSYSVDEGGSPTLSESSSIDRVTVINKRDEFSKICKAFEQRFLKTNYVNYTNNSNNNKNAFKSKNGTQKKKKGNCKVPEVVEPKEPIELAIQKHELNSIAENSQGSDQNPCNADSISVINSCSRKNVAFEPTFSCSSVNKSDIDNKTKCLDLVVKHSTIKSCNSGSSKAEFAADEANMLKEKTAIEIPLPVRLPQLKGIPRGIFRKGCQENLKAITFKNDEQKGERPCLVTAMPRACAMPKLSGNEIKRRIATIRFPVVILGKDQVGAPLKVPIDNNSPQFDGLDAHIWPFMMAWYDVKPLKSSEPICEQTVKKENSQWVHIQRRGGNIVYPDFKKRKQNNELLMKHHMKNKNVKAESKSEPKRPMPIVYPEVNIKLPPYKKRKPITQLKDRMLNLLFQKVSDRITNNDNYVSPRSSNPTKQIDTCAVTEKKPIDVSARPKISKSPERYKSPDLSQHKKYNRTGFGYPWAKAKWASDFIENVIKKVKNGVYYSQDKSLNSITETAIQTKNTCDQEEFDFSPKVTITKKQPELLKSIPGFDNSLPVLEIKTLNKNQISVKHCVSNVTMQFDVSFLVQTKQILMSPKTSLALIPVDVTGSQTKTFKCDTTILNAMLPAELCSILPKMINQFEFAISSNLSPTACSVTACPVTKPEIQSCLSTISEVPYPTEVIHSSITLFDLMSPEKKKVLKGMFSIVKDNATTKVVTPSIDDDFLMIELLPKMFFKYSDILDYRIRSFIPEFSDVEENKIIISNELKSILPDVSEEMHFNSSALELYTNKNKRLVTSFKLYDVAATIKNVLNIQKLNKITLLPIINILGIKYDGKLLNVQMKIADNNGIEKNVSVAINNLEIDTGPKCIEHSSMQCIEYNNESTHADVNKHRCSKTAVKRTNINNRRKYRRLYKKCKIQPLDNNTALDKIETLGDFLQIIGAKSAVSNIFDDYSERKVLSSVKEMQNWITDINPAQALLVLLLTNKKDTSNLVRFRPIILQGIAVNRITRASELDMEIEVIERENLNKVLPQYDGISYLPESTENHDQLLEELYWIAKTTASDYQKPFDESSERLLKSLLEKRKKLNPSYLRVMARYVGLGLLKSPAKK